MLSLKLTSCRECSLIPQLLDNINCQLAKMSNNLYLNLVYMLDRPVEASNMSTLLHYKRILTYKNCNPDWAVDYSIEKIGSKVNFLTANCDCCDQTSNIFDVTTTTTTTTVLTTTTTTTV